MPILTLTPSVSKKEGLLPPKTHEDISKEGYYFSYFSVIIIKHNEQKKHLGPV